MDKIVHIFLLVFFITQNLYSKEPTLAVLTGIESNGLQKFKIKSYSFNCQAYGVLGIDELYKSENLNTECKKSIERFYLKRPDLKYYTHSKLNVRQFYSIEFKNEKCIVYASGGKSLSEFLLQEGLAVLRPFFKDDEFKHYFYKSQQSAKILKKGYGEKILSTSVKVIYKTDKRVCIFYLCVIYIQNSLCEWPLFKKYI